MRYLYVERAAPTLCIRCHAMCVSGFFACTKMCVELDAWMNMPEGCQTSAEPGVGPTPGTRGAHAGYSLYVRRLRSSEHLAHTQRVSNICPAMYARAIRSGRQQHVVHSLDFFLTCAPCMRSACTLYTSSVLATCCACVVNSFASLQILTKAGRTTTHWSHFPFLRHFQCADRTVRRVCVTGPYNL